MVEHLDALIAAGQAQVRSWALAGRSRQRYGGQTGGTFLTGALTWEARIELLPACVPWSIHWELLELHEVYNDPFSLGGRRAAGVRPEDPAGSLYGFSGGSHACKLGCSGVKEWFKKVILMVRGMAGGRSNFEVFLLVQVVAGGSRSV
eukprot:Skav212793  [mRNA]  locus=scaffold159:509783:515702:- [translate_table: standard]